MVENIAGAAQAEKEIITAIIENTDPNVLWFELCYFEAALGPRLELFPAHITQALKEMKEVLNKASWASARSGNCTG